MPVGRAPLAKSVAGRAVLAFVDVPAAAQRALEGGGNRQVERKGLAAVARGGLEESDLLAGVWARTRCASVCRTGWFTGTGTITQVPMASVRCAGHAAIGRLLPAAGKNPGKNPAIQKLKKTLGLNSTVREKDSTVLTLKVTLI